MSVELGIGGIVRIDGKYVGRLSNGIYTTDRGPLHYYDKWHGFGITNEVLLLLRSKGCSKVVIRYRSPEWVHDYEQRLDDLMGEPIVGGDRTDEQRILRVPLEDHMKLHWALLDARGAW